VDDDGWFHVCRHKAGDSLEHGSNYNYDNFIIISGAHGCCGDFTYFPKTFPMCKYRLHCACVRVPDSMYM
jgi:hypothetical protein